MKRAVATSGALTFMPLRLIEAEAASGSLAAIPIRERTWRRRADLVRRANTTLSPAARALVAEIRRVCREA